MKKILIVIAMAMAATIADAQSYEFTDIQVNTETEVHVATPLEPLPHTFINVGYSIDLASGLFKGVPSIMVGWYKLHGIFAGFSFSVNRVTDTDSYEKIDSYHWKELVDDGKTPDNDNISLFTVGYIYNTPYSRTTGSDLDNILQLYAGLGYGSIKSYMEYDHHRSKVTKEGSGIAFDLGMLITYNHFNFRAGVKAIAGGGGYFDVGIGLGYTF